MKRGGLDVWREKTLFLSLQSPKNPNFLIKCKKKKKKKGNMSLSFCNKIAYIQIQAARSDGDYLQNLFLRLSAQLASNCDEGEPHL